MSIKSPK